MKPSHAEAPYVMSFVGADGQEMEHEVSLSGRRPLAMPAVDHQLQKEQWELTQALDQVRATRSAHPNRPGRPLHSFGPQGS